MGSDTRERETPTLLSESETRERLTEVFKREYQKEVDRARSQLSHRKKDRGDAAEDIVTRAFHKVLEKLEESVVIGNLVGYLRGAVRNELRNEYRYDDTRRQSQPALDYETEWMSLSPEALYLTEEEQQLLVEASETLSPKCRAAFRWVLWEGLSLKEVVARFASQGIVISERQVSRYVDKGSETCRRALNSDDDSEPRQDPPKE